ncbi:MAG: hypothetical protein E6344_15845 [Clostridium sp.]|uniref:hypothetical protein n=1 Tax=Clostridium culturomicium TaxID=1499683 RepID=UPI0005907908|nr:hypothetical protein [Clostridium sp.]MDU7085168.1 hypothetical protein [Clostridium sp.]
MVGKSKKKGNNPNNKNIKDGVQVLNNQVKDAHHIESATIANGLFGVEIKDNLIDPDTRYYI